MVLYIDTTDFNKMVFAVSPDDRHQGARRPSSRDVGFKKISYKVDPHKSHETLEKLEEFLKSVGIKPSPVLRGSAPPPIHRRQGYGGQEGRGRGHAITKIVVNKGPGSYTGVRVGVTLAMALGFAWGITVIPLDGKKFTKSIF